MIVTVAMTQSAECAHVNENLVDTARKMRDLGVGALPICGEDDRLHGMITDRDLVVRCVAEGVDPATVKVESFTGDKPVTIGADDSIDEAVNTMTQHNVRRLPVIDGHELVGMLSQADIAEHCSQQQVSELVGAISSAPDNN